MSSMLDQAILDAVALKEAALKNAELMVLERYAPQIKEAVESLLEQDDEDLALADPLGGDSMGMPPTEDPLAKDLTLAATDGESTCPCPEDEEEIEIDFDELSQMSSGGDELGGLPGQMGDPLAPTMEEDGMFMEEDSDGVEIPAQLGPELHMYHMGMGDPVYKVGSLAYAGKPVPRSLLDSAINQLESTVGKINVPEEKQELESLISQLQSSAGTEDTASPEDENPIEQPTAGLAEEVDSDMEELSEESLNDLMEMLQVDVHTVPHGHPGHATDAERIQSGEIELAHVQDTEVAEENAELKKAVEALQEQNQSLKKQVKSIILEYNKIKGIAMGASKKLEELNIQNAQLMYKNRVLESVSLNERQKQKIVEAISKINSVNEVKVVFETLFKSFTSKVDGRPLPKTLNEAISKNNFNSIRPRESLTESINPQKERMQILAGISKKQ